MRTFRATARLPALVPADTLVVSLVAALVASMIAALAASTGGAAEVRLRDATFTLPDGYALEVAAAPPPEEWPPEKPPPEENPPPEEPKLDEPDPTDQLTGVESTTFGITFSVVFSQPQCRQRSSTRSSPSR